MYSGLADVTFFHQYQPLPPDRMEVYFNVGVDIILSAFAPNMAQLAFDSAVVGVTHATHVRVRLPDGLEYGGEIKPRPAGFGVLSVLFLLEQVENTSGEER